MNFEGLFQQRLDTLHREGRYRIFADLKRRRGCFPVADHFAANGAREVTVWCSNDYLGMGQHPAVLTAMHEAIDAAGAGSGGTRNISGTTHYHVELESELADLHGKESALLFTSAYVANDATLSTLLKLVPGTVVFSDEKNHASMIEGIRHGRCEKHIFRHNDVADLEAKLKQISERHAQAYRLRERLLHGRAYRADRGDLRSRREVRRAHLPRRGARGRHVRPARRGHRRARRRHGPGRHHQRHARQGVRRHGRLHRRLPRPLRCDPLVCLGVHLHDIARACGRGRGARFHPPFEDERTRARPPPGAGSHAQDARSKQSDYPSWTTQAISSL